ncbi:MAG: hypothetical protein ACN6I6_02175 [bacterium]
MDKNIRFDHSYTKDQSHKLLKKLMKLGFSKIKFDVEHPGKHFCSFIEFNNPIGSRTYLEFIHTGRGGSMISSPGISFGYEKNLEGYFKRLKKNCSFEPQYSHKNYNWKENSEDILPGWNFITFKKLGFRTIEPWFTEYESPRKKRKHQISHSNNTNQLSGGELVLNPKGADFIEAVLKVKIKDKFSLADGTIWKVKKGAVNRMERINLRASSLKAFPKKLHIDTGIVLIKNPSGEKFWDICIYEN